VRRACKFVPRKPALQKICFRTAAPAWRHRVTGAIALLLSRTAKAGKVSSGNQIASALCQKTQNYSGPGTAGKTMVSSMWLPCLLHLIDDSALKNGSKRWMSMMMASVFRLWT
jgi:hypothetical protein